MRRCPTLSELAWPDEVFDSESASVWAQSVAIRVLRWTWMAFDRLQEEVLDNVDLRQPLEQLERDLVRGHFIRLQAIYFKETRGFAALIPVHEWPELESRSPPPARPPCYDLGFVYQENQRWSWPIEAKVLRTPRALSKYLTDVNVKFGEGTAAPIVGEGGMIAYLLSGKHEDLFARLQERLSAPLFVVPGLEDRPHRASMHQRKIAPELRLHHMVMACCRE